MNSFKFAVLVVLCYATFVVYAEDGDDDEDEIEYECRKKRGFGESPKKAVKQTDKQYARFADCREKCIELKKQFHRVDGVSFRKAEGCFCFLDMKRINTEKKYQKFFSCHLKADEPNEMNGVGGREGGATDAVDLSYSYFKDLNCDVTWTKVGCFNTKGRDRFLLNYRYDIEWAPTRFPSFAKSFICACAEAARLNKVQYFGTHYWGECWEIDPEDIAEPSTGCELADGTYKNQCAGLNTGGECLGSSGYYIYTNVGTESEEDKKKREAKRGIPKRDFKKDY